MGGIRHQLQERLKADLGDEAHRVRITGVEAMADVCRIRAELVVENVTAPLEAIGSSPDAAYAVLITEILERVEQLGELIDRGLEPCWVCGARDSRSTMEVEDVGAELWWLCRRCQRRRDNAAKFGLIWPAEFDAWWKRWSAQRRVEGRDDAWLTAIRRRADEIHDTDPHTPNRMAAVLKVAEAG